MSSADRLEYSNLAVERVLRILKTFSSWQRELSFRDIAQQTNIPPSTVYKLIRILVRYDVLEQRGADGVYGIGKEVFRLGDLHLTNKALVDTASPLLDDLVEQLGFTTSLAIRDDGKLIVMLSKVGTSPISVASLDRSNGENWCIHQSALGKALLLDVSDQKLAEMLPHPPWPETTPNSLRNLEELREDLDSAKSRGYALDDEESTRGLRCVGVPIRNHTKQIVAAISVSATTLEITDQSLPGIIECLQETGVGISRKLGYHA